MRFMTCSLVTAGLLACTNPLGAQDSARAIVEKAIEAHGGEAELAKIRTMRLKLEGKMPYADSTVPCILEETWRLPDQYKSVLSVESLKFRAVLVINKDQAWAHQNGRTSALDRAALADEQEQQYVRGLNQFGFLKDKGYVLSVLDEVKVAGAPTVGVLVKSQGHRDVKLYFDKASGLLLKREHRVPGDPGKEILQEVFFSDYREKAELKYAGKLLVQQDGKKILEGAVVDIEFPEKLNENVFTKP